MQTAPALTIDTNQVSPDNFDVNLADKELASLISFLIGTKDVSVLPFEEGLALVEKYYGNQPQWKNLLLNYFSYTLEKEKEEITNQQIALLNDLLIDLESEEEDISNSTVLS